MSNLTLFTDFASEICNSSLHLIHCHDVTLLGITAIRSLISSLRSQNRLIRKYIWPLDSQCKTVPVTALVVIDSRQLNRCTVNRHASKRAGKARMVAVEACFQLNCY